MLASVLGRPRPMSRLVTAAAVARSASSFSACVAVRSSVTRLRSVAREIRTTFSRGAAVTWSTNADTALAATKSGLAPAAKLSVHMEKVSSYKSWELGVPPPWAPEEDLSNLVRYPTPPWAPNTARASSRRSRIVSDLTAVARTSAFRVGLDEASWSQIQATRGSTGEVWDSRRRRARLMAAQPLQYGSGPSVRKTRSKMGTSTSPEVSWNSRARSLRALELATSAPPSRSLLPERTSSIRVSAYRCAPASFIFATTF
mmetsp:Transcript_26327/g.58933  ORF Transcript_26327/g.58933 Transcript_26327/m.58933 type:complete len:258 (-) Transcript_26327:246-1019(-)